MSMVKPNRICLMVYLSCSRIQEFLNQVSSHHFPKMSSIYQHDCKVGSKRTFIGIVWSKWVHSSKNLTHK